MHSTPIAMIQTFIQRLFCNRLSPLLAAFVEGGLSEKERTKVAAHLKTCAGCRQEVEELTELGKLLRSHPPAVPQLKPDLWSRIQAEIVAESAAEPERPVGRPIPRRQPAPTFQWSSFGLSFATTGTLVAAAVVGVVVLTKPLLHSPVDMEMPIKKSTTALASGTANREPITLTFRSPAKSEPAKPKPEPVAKAILDGAARVASDAVRPARPVKAPQVALVRRRGRYSNRTETASVARKPRPILAGKQQFYAVAVEKKNSARTLIAEPDMALSTPEQPVNTVKMAEKPYQVAMATPEMTDTPVEVVAPRDVPAAGSVNDTVKIQTRTILFVYSGR